MKAIQVDELLRFAQAALEAVGVGAVVWGVLYTSRIKDTVFAWDKVLNFDGETGPYVQYTHARCCSVLRKAARLLANCSRAAKEPGSFCSRRISSAPWTRALALLMS